MIDWHPIAELQTDKLSEDTTFLVWCPDLRASGPPVVAYWQNNAWVIAYSGEDLPDVITHYAEINSPGE